MGARRYMRTKLRMDPTTRVEKTKSSSLSPKLGREAMSPSTQAVTPTSSSIRTLKGNCGSAKTLARHPFRKSPKGPTGSSDGWGSSPGRLPPPPPPPPRPDPDPLFWSDPDPDPERIGSERLGFREQGRSKVVILGEGKDSEGRWTRRPRW